MLSPKDLCAISDLKELIEAGVASLKIEGRMKQPDYASTVVSVYRKYLDSYYEGDEIRVSKEDRQRLYDSGNRSGFTDAYFFTHNSPKMMSVSDSSHESALSEAKKPLLPSIPMDGFVCAKAGQTLALTLKKGDICIEVTGACCELAKNRPTTAEEIKDKLCRTKDTPFAFDTFEVETDGRCFVPHSALKALRREGLIRLQQSCVSGYHRLEHPKEWKYDSTSFNTVNQISTCKENRKNSNYSKKNQFLLDNCLRVYLRVQTTQQLIQAEKFTQIEALIVPFHLGVEWRKQKRDRQRSYIFALPLILRKETMEAYAPLIRQMEDDFFEASSYDGLGFLQECGVPTSRILLGERIYALSNYTRAIFSEMGYKNASVPIELSKKELGYRDNALDRFLVYGRIPLMITANCQKKWMHRCPKELSQSEKKGRSVNPAANRQDKGEDYLLLRDRKGKQFPVFADCRICANILYNSVPLDLIDRLSDVLSLHPGALELSFTTESAEEMERIWARFSAAARGETMAAPDVPFTRGHFGKC